MGLLTLLNSGVSNLGYDGAPVPSTINNNPVTFTRHWQFSINGTPNVANNIVVGGVTGLQAPPVTYIPSILEESDPLNTSIYRNAPNQGYLDNLPG
jgi:hypothetical protein